MFEYTLITLLSWRPSRIFVFFFVFGIQRMILGESHNFEMNILNVMNINRKKAKIHK